MTATTPTASPAAAPAAAALPLAAETDVLIPAIAGNANDTQTGNGLFAALIECETADTAPEPVTDTKLKLPQLTGTEPLPVTMLLVPPLPALPMVELSATPVLPAATATPPATVHVTTVELVPAPVKLPLPTPESVVSSDVATMPPPAAQTAATPISTEATVAAETVTAMEPPTTDVPPPPVTAAFTPAATPLSAKTTDGTPIAKVEVDVKATTTSEKIAQPPPAESAPQRAPSVDVKTRPQPSSPIGQSTTERLVSTAPVTTATTSKWKSPPVSTPAPVLTRIETRDCPASEPERVSAPPPIVETIANRVSTEAVAFRKTGTQSVEVAVRADGGTELSVRFTMRRGQVEVTARVERGDLQTLKAHWSELQQTLAQQGIQVNRLSEASRPEPMPAGHAGQAAHDSRSSGHQPHHRRPAPEAESEPVFVGATSEPVGKRGGRKASHGWEVWA
jgi:hypothetical protein